MNIARSMQVAKRSQARQSNGIAIPLSAIITAGFFIMAPVLAAESNLSTLVKEDKPTVTIVTAALPLSSAEKITWEHILLGPGGGWTMIKIDPQNDDVVYIASDMSNWGKSVDGGKTWTDLTPAQLEVTGRGGVIDNGLVIDPKDPNTLYLASGGVAKSSDGGKSWKMVFGSLETRQFGLRLAMDPKDNQVIYVGGYAGEMAKTENAGNTWTNLPGNGFGQVRKGGADLINIVVGHDHAVYACMYGKGILKSADGGQLWTTNNVGLPHLNIGSFQGVAGKDKTVFYALPFQGKDSRSKEISTAGGLYRSVNGAKSWEKVKVLDEEKYKGRNPPTWCQMAVSPVDPNIIYITADNVLEEWGNNGTYRTFDGGKTWAFLAGQYDRNLLDWDPAMFEYIKQYGCDVFAVSPKNPKKLYRANQSCAFRSDDGGESWKILSQEDAGEGYYRSTGLEDICLLGIAVDPKDSRRVYFGTSDNGFLKSRDGGKTWKGGFVKGLGIRTERVDQILVDPDVPATLYLGNALFRKGTAQFIGYFAISRDYGESWEKSELHPEWGLPKRANVVALALDSDSPADARVLYASLLGEGVWKTENGGMNWKPCHQGLPEVKREGVGHGGFGRQIIQLVKPKGTGLAYAVVCEQARLLADYSSIYSPSVEGNGLYLSENRGETWSQVKFEGAVPAVIKEIAVDPKNPAILYAACKKEGVWKSMDKGKTWKKVLGVEPGVPFYQVAVDNFNSSRVYATGEIKYSINYGVWISEDGGSNWTHEIKGFGHRVVQALYADPTAEGIIWAGTYGNAVFKGYVKAAAAPKEIKEPARSPLEENKSPLKALTEAETLEQIKAASLSAVKADGPMTIDGNLAEPAWTKATAVTGFYNTRRRTLVEKQTTVKALYDNEFLYLGIVCQEPNPNLIKAESKKHDGDVWADDAVEVFIAKGVKGDIFQFIVNAAGSRFDAAYGRALICDASWNPAPDWKAVAKKGKAEWTIEMAIPLKAVTGPGTADEPWRIKLCRDDTLTPATSTWPASVKPEFICSPALFAPVMLGASGTVK